MITGKVKTTEKLILQEDNSTILNVELELLDGDTVVEIRKLGFPLNATPEEIKAELVKYVATYNAEKEMALVNAERDAIEAQATKTIEEINGLEI